MTPEELTPYFGKRVRLWALNDLEPRIGILKQWDDRMVELVPLKIGTGFYDRKDVWRVHAGDIRRVEPANQ
jgi:hypothetical protein